MLSPGPRPLTSEAGEPLLSGTPGPCHRKEGKVSPHTYKRGSSPRHRAGKGPGPPSPHTSRSSSGGREHQEDTISHRQGQPPGADPGPAHRGKELMPACASHQASPLDMQALHWPKAPCRPLSTAHGSLVLLSLQPGLPQATAAPPGQQSPRGRLGFPGALPQRRVVWMWFGAFPGALGLGRAQPQRRGTSP